MSILTLYMVFLLLPILAEDRQQAICHRTPKVIEPAVVPLACDDLLGLDEAPQKLDQKDARKAELVKLRFCAGLTVAQAAQPLDVSTSTAEKDWTYARSWLKLGMSGGRSDESA